MSFSIQWLENRGVTAPQGFRAGAARAAIKTTGDDLALLVADEHSSAAAVFTTNQVKAAPVLVSAAHLAQNCARAIVVNAGNANCCTGARGLENARQMAILAAQKLGISPEQVLVCSTGIIGHQLPIEKIAAALETLRLSGEEDAVQTPAEENEVVTLDGRAEISESEAITSDHEVAASSDEGATDEGATDEGATDEGATDEGATSDSEVLIPDDQAVTSDGKIAILDGEAAAADDETARIDEVSASEFSVDETVARAFMTTDTVPKFCAASLEIGGKTVTVGGQAKGVGMIGPNMAPLSPPALHATLLAFLTTDAQIERKLLQKLLERAVARSFNSVTVDGDMSTNDSAILLASGASGCQITEQNAPLFSGLLDAVCIELGKKIARDGEGATKLIEIRVKGARRESDAKKIALTIANSPLVKTAIFGKDPNWGRIAMAAGKAGVDFDAQNLSFALGEIELFRAGEPVDFDVKSAESVLEAADVLISLDLGEGSATWTAWTCDFSYDYVKINAEYHT